MKAAINTILGVFGLRLSRRQTSTERHDHSPDLSEEDKATIATVCEFTMTGPERLAAVIAATRHVVKNNIPGDIVECGVWRGGSMMAIARTLIELGDTSRRLYLYDTFEGMSAPTAADVDLFGRSAGKLLEAEPHRTESIIWAHASLEDVRRNLLSTGYPVEQFRFVVGKVEETIPATMPGSIALLRLDTDWYESTTHELHHLYPRLSAWGPILIDDYGHWQGARKAVDEYLQTLPYPLFLNRVDYTARLAIKPGPL